MRSIHKAVLLHEIVDAFVGMKAAGDKLPIYLDGTLGGCGHALAIAEAVRGKLKLIGLDMDKGALERAEEVLAGKAKEVVLEEENFRNLNLTLEKHGMKKADFIIFDLGISSDELEGSGKGFSFDSDEPLVMTMGDPGRYAFTAGDIVNGWAEGDIANVIFAYGEERYARRIARRIVDYRTKKKIETAAELAEIVRMAVPRTFGRRINPATKTFQALRIATNDELEALKEGLKKGYERLSNGGRMAVISFHSLEDRIVKNFYKTKEREDGAIISKKPIRPEETEIRENPRSRSAKLRIIEKTK